MNVTLPDTDWVALASVTLVFGGAAAAFAAAQWRGAQVAVAEAALKRDLLDRGFSADEVVRVVEATARREGGCGRRKLRAEAGRVAGA